MISFVFLSILFFLFLLVNSFFLSKIWTTKYSNLNFFESYFISFLIFIFILFLIFTPIQLINNSLISNQNNNFNIFDYSKYILLVIQIIFAIIYLFNLRKFSFNINFDWKKIFIFVIISLTFLLSWFLLVDDSYFYNQISINSFKNTDSISSLISNIFINIFYKNVSNVDLYYYFFKYCFFPLFLVILSFVCSSIFDYYSLYSLRNLKKCSIVLFVYSLIIYLLTRDNINILWLNIIYSNFYWIVPIIIISFSLIYKHKLDIITSNELFILINSIVLSVQFFGNKLSIFSLLIMILYVLYVSVYKVNSFSYENLKVMSYALLSFSLSNFYYLDNSKSYIYIILFVVSILFLIIIYIFNKTNRFYFLVNKIDKFVNKYIYFIILSILISIILISLLINDFDLSIYYNFFWVDNKLVFNVVTYAIFWLYSIIMILYDFKYKNKSNHYKFPILSLCLYMVVVNNPFFINLFSILLNHDEFLNYFNLFSWIIILVVIYFSFSAFYISNDNINNIMFFKKNIFLNNDLKCKIFSISTDLMILSLLTIPSILIIICGVEKWII